MSKQRIVQFENKVEDERKIRVDRRKERVVRSYVRVMTVLVPIDRVFDGA